MSKILFSFALIVTSVGALATENKADEAAIRSIVSASEAAANKRDFAAFAAMFTADGDSIVFDGPRDVGRDAIRHPIEIAWKEQPASCRIALKVESIRFLSKDIAIVEDSASFTGCKDVVPDRATFVFARRDGKWQIAAMRVYQAEKK